MSRPKKLKLICYKGLFLKTPSCLLLSAFLFRSFFVYNGRKYELFTISSHFLLFFYFRDFVFSTKFGPIHSTSKKKAKLKGKK